ncbi:unnamed protein product [Bursaphelenchus okinawaensis]|uniref:G-protein coupled receptors family 1 profile domain-containing protein n=1 Tax=Bursaphelenchus okinawaensis TaxID=465554 RepID=A0A811L9K7_9BILA|nr:unnamed protein product [Bursaphelenchus okinawaensis]CAG9120401.1 unnamed protein product [Bursaphelenchus okinawaensis]
MLTTDNYTVYASEDEVFEDGNDYMLVLSSIVIIGLVGNIVSLVTILNSRLKKVTANQYLIVLTASDSVFLGGMILILFKVDYINFHFCVVIEYILMTSSYISSWSIVALTIERYIAIAHPLKHMKLSHIPRAKIMAYWVPIPFLFNLIQFITLSPTTADPDWPNVKQCGIQEGPLQMTVEISDVLLSYVMPCLTVVFLNTFIASTVHKAGKGLFGSQDNLSTSESRHNRNRRSGNSNSGSTRILLVVPIVYTVLNTPFYLMRIMDTLALNLFNSKAFSMQEMAEDPLAVFFYNAAHYLYYLNFASDFMVYAFTSANFRKSVTMAWAQLLCPKWAATKYHREIENTLVSQRTQVPSFRHSHVKSANNTPTEL